MAKNLGKTSSAGVGSGAELSSPGDADDVAADNGTGNDTAAAWSFEADDSLSVLSTDSDGETVMPVDCWRAEDGWIHLQLTGGSIPGIELDRVMQDGSALVTVLKSSDGITTMDLRVFAWRLIPSASSEVAKIDAVRLDRGDGNLTDLPIATGR